jgi:hypothetical protein
MPHPRPAQFRIRSLCVAVAIVAVALGGWIRYHAWQPCATLDHELRRIDEILRANNSGRVGMFESRMSLDGYLHYTEEHLAQGSDTP